MEGPQDEPDGDYDDANIFARIVRGEIPSAKVWEDDKVLVFMDAFPQSPGHTLVVHKTSRARNLLEAEPQTLTDLILAVQRTARAVRAALNPDGIVITQSTARRRPDHLPPALPHPAAVGERAPEGHAQDKTVDQTALKAMAADIASKLD